LIGEPSIAPTVRAVGSPAGETLHTSPPLVSRRGDDHHPVVESVLDDTLDLRCVLARMLMTRAPRLMVMAAG